MTDYLCIGVPYFLGERVAGREEVAKIEASGFADEIGAHWITLEPAFASEDPIVAVNNALAAVIAAHPGHVPVVFAADCTSALGTMKGLERRNPAVLWYDAHGDFNTPETTPSGFLGGMPLAMLVGRGDMKYMAAVGLTPVPEDEVVITDARDLDPEEAVMLRESAITHLPDVNGLLTANLPQKPLYIHFDTDVVTLDDMPGMSYPSAGGPSLDTAANTLRFVAQNKPVAGILFSLWNDALPTEGKSLASTLYLAKAFVDGNKV